MSSNNRDDVDLLMKIFTPVLLLVGLIGNTLIIVILRQSEFKQYRSLNYFVLLAVLDTCVLYSGCLQVASNAYFSVDIRTINSVLCRLFSFIVYFFTHFVSIYLVCINLNRVLVLKHAHLKQAAPFKAFFFTALFLFLVNSHFLVFNRLIEIDLNVNRSGNKNQLLIANRSIHTVRICFCYENTKYFHFIMNYLPWLDLSIYIYLPFASIILFSALIIRRLFGNKSTFEVVLTNHKYILSTHEKHSYVLLLVKNSVFLCMLTPLAIINSTGYLNENRTITTLIYVFAYMNYS